MSTTFYIFLGLIIIVAFLLVVIIMVQNPKGGGLSSSFGGGGSQQLGGVQKTNDFLDKGTWGLATLLIVLILLINIPIFGNSGANRSRVDNNSDVPAQQTQLPSTGDNTSTGGDNGGQP